MSTLRKINCDKVDLTISGASNYAIHEASLKAQHKFIKEEEEWKQLVSEGKARVVRIPIVKGYRIHYELI